MAHIAFASLRPALMVLRRAAALGGEPGQHLPGVGVAAEPVIQTQDGLLQLFVRAAVAEIFAQGGKAAPPQFSAAAPNLRATRRAGQKAGARTSA